MADGESGAPKKKKSELSKRARQQIENQMAAAEAERKRILWQKRMDLVNAGVRSYKNQKMGEAVTNYRSYLRILEDWKGVPQGGLIPSIFDKQKELQELLLISGVYWDLVRLYDRTKSADKKKDFMQFLEKYILFSKDMPFQPVCAESLRKYISREKPRHVAEFKNAYRILAPTASKCFVATSLLDVTEPETHVALRAFRDRVLMESRPGRWFVRAYYRVGPVIAAVLDRAPGWVRTVCGRALDRLASFMK